MLALPLLGLLIIAAVCAWACWPIKGRKLRVTMLSVLVLVVIGAVGWGAAHGAGEDVAFLAAPGFAIAVLRLLIEFFTSLARRFPDP